MGNDSGLRKKSKQRTVDHKKHAMYPGGKLPPNAYLERGVIKFHREQEPFVYVAPPRVVSKPGWEAVDAAVRRINDFQVTNKSSYPLAGRMNIERDYGLAYRELIRQGMAAPIRRKYRFQ